MVGILLSIFTSFEPIDCEAVSIFENPVYTHNTVQTLWVQSFGILPYTRIALSTSPAKGGAGNIGIGISNFGNTLYQENELILGYNLNFNKMKVGISTSLMRVQIDEYGETFAFRGNLGLGCQITPNLSCDFAIHNFSSSNISDEKLPGDVIGGISVIPDQQITTRFQLYKEERYPIEFKLTNEVKLSDFLTLHIGLKTYPESFTFGILLNYKQFGISYYARTHPYLDLTHIIGIKLGGVE